MKIHNIKFCNPRTKAPPGAFVVNTTSVSKDFGVAFSPMLNQPIEINGISAKNVENLWQFTKCYKEHVENPKGWILWRDNGLRKERGVRYPMGKDARPEFSYLTKELGRLDYISARRNIYIPAYIQKLEKYCQPQVNSLIDILTITDVYLWDFDVRDIGDKTFLEILHDQYEKMGHAFVLAKYISNKIYKTTGIEIWR